MNKGRGNAPEVSGHVRLIGGLWRGSKLPVPGLAGLRPTSDRVRETLFNWLQPALPGAHVLDLFAGSGALGFEAASRGAARVDLVEASPLAATMLRDSAARLGRDGSGGEVVVHGVAAQAFLAGHAGPWDIAFVDPPFDLDLWGASLAALAPKLAPRAWVYVEAPASRIIPVPAGWAQHRELSTREVRATLWRVGPA